MLCIAMDYECSAILLSGTHRYTNASIRRRNVFKQKQAIHSMGIRPTPPYEYQDPKMKTKSLTQ